MSDVAVLGGGLAGLSCATLLAQRGFNVTLVEQSTFPTHRVCGEYLSNETEPFLTRLGLDMTTLGSKQLSRFELTTRAGRQFRCALPGGGIGVSRYRLDQALLLVAQSCGVTVRTKTVVHDVGVYDAERVVHTSAGAVRARVVLGCFGKRSRIDRALGRPNFKRRTPYVGVKRHFRGPFPQDTVGLHVIPGGYCGISPVEDDLVNVCYLTRADVLNALGSVRGFERKGLRQNPALARYLDAITPAFDPPLVISQVDFAPKPIVYRGVLMLGDAAGLIHPLCGNGMAMALRSAALVTPLIESFLRGTCSQVEMERRYESAWRAAFRERRLLGRWLQPLLESPALSETACFTARHFPRVTSTLIRHTHGLPF